MAMANYTATWVDLVPGVSFKIYDTIPNLLLASVPAGVFTATLSLDDATQHQLVVTAVGPAGESLPSNMVILVPSKPTPPTNFTVVKA